MNDSEKDMILCRLLKCEPSELIGNERKLYEVVLNLLKENRKLKEKIKYYELLQERDCDEEFEL